MGAWRPGWTELRAIREHVQHGHGGCLLDQQSENLSGVVGCGPVQVFPRHQYWLPLGLYLQPCHQRVQRLLFLLFATSRPAPG